MSDSNDIVKVDARGLACPEPLMLAKSAMNRAGGKAVEVTVDTETAKGNIVRMAGREKRDVETREEGELFVVRIGGKKA